MGMLVLMYFSSLPKWEDYIQSCYSVIP